MFPVRQDDPASRQYHDHLALIRERVLAFLLRRLVPRHADFSEAEDLAQSCIVVLWEHYSDKRDLSEMTAIAIGIARNKIAQFHRDRDRRPELADAQVSAPAPNALDHIAARESMDRLLRAMLQLSSRCRDLLRLKLIEQKSYAEIRILLGITGNIYEMTRRCHRSLLRIAGGNPL
jgi:RNA polymerase sigma factor (sigma-70 family)